MRIAGSWKEGMNQKHYDQVHVRQTKQDYSHIVRETATAAVLISFLFLALSDSSLSRDLFAELALGYIVAATVEVSLFICSGSVRARGIVETSVSAMVSMTSGEGVPVRSVFQS
ncbi:hypothetical protein Tco_0240626 [Tanacetum coccineum]